MLSILNGIDSSIHICHPVTHELLFANESFKKIWGDFKEGDKCHKIMHGRDVPCFFCDNEWILNQPSGARPWLRLDEKTGKQYLCASRGIVWDDGSSVKLEQLTDVSDHLTQGSLQENSELFHEIFDCHNAVMLVIDPVDGRIVRANDASTRFYGYTHEQFATMNIFQINMLSPDKIKSEIAEAKIEKRNKFEFPHRLSSGEIRTVEVFSNPLTVDGRKLLYSFVNDITERKKAEEALVASENRFRSIIDSSPVPMALNDEQRRITFLNSAFVKTFGYTIEDIPTLEDWWQKAYPDPEYRKWVENTWREELDRAKRTDTVFAPIELSIACKNGLTRIVMASASSIAKSFQGNHLVMLYDITELKAAEDMRRKYQEQEKHAVVGRVAGKMAHDFNNVLGIIMGTSQLMMTEYLAPEVRAEIEIILESAGKGRDLTRNLLLFARDQEPKLFQFNLNERIDAVIRSLKSELKDVKLTLSYGSGLDEFLADAGLLENALINMIHNSIHAMSKTEAPELSVRTYEDGGRAFIEIRDNGCGIPLKWQDRIYDPSVTLKGSEDREGAYRKDIKGSGYGMANVKRCVDKHGGAISLESEPGKGAKFTIELPIVKASLKEEEIKSIQERQAAEGMSVLVVEDEPHFGRILAALLHKCNHRAHLATNGEMALSYLKNGSFDAVSLDYILPDMNGMDVYREIRKTNQDVPVVFVSGNFEFMQSMIDLERDDPRVAHLAKPFNNVDYINKMNAWLAAKS